MTYIISGGTEGFQHLPYGQLSKDFSGPSKYLLAPRILSLQMIFSAH